MTILDLNKSFRKCIKVIPGSAQMSGNAVERLTYTFIEDFKSKCMEFGRIILPFFLDLILPKKKGK